MTSKPKRRYLIDRAIGRGGMAEVFLGRMIGPDGFERTVCIKRISEQHSRSPGFEAMFRDEARLAASLSHANVVQVFDFDRDEENRLFIAMEYVEGVSLKRFLVALAEQGIHPGPEITAAVARGVLEGLHHAWTARWQGRPLRVIHRDLSPHNVLLSVSGEVKIADFGIAKAYISAVRTRTGVVKGKAPYMSPEQAAARKLDCRSDLYSLGVMLWEMVAERRLFATSGKVDWAAIATGRRKAPPLLDARPDAPAGLAHLVDSLLRSERDRRPPDAAAALDLLESSGVTPAFAHKLGQLVETTRPAAPGPPGSLEIGPTEPAGSRAAETTVLSSSPASPLGSGDILDTREPVEQDRVHPGTRVASPRERSRPREHRPGGPDGPRAEHEIQPVSIRREETGSTSHKLVTGGLMVLAGVVVGFALLAAFVVFGLPRVMPGRQAGEPPRVPAPEAATGGTAERTASPETGALAAPVPEDERPIVPEQRAQPEAEKPVASKKPKPKPKPKGRINVNARPWAEVWLDGTNVGSTPLQIDAVAAGKHEIVLVDPSTGEKERVPVRVKPGGTEKVAVDFTAD